MKQALGEVPAAWNAKPTVLVAAARDEGVLVAAASFSSSKLAAEIEELSSLRF